MAEEQKNAPAAPDTGDAAPATEEGAAAATPANKKKLYLIGAGVAALLLVFGIVGYFILGSGETADEGPHEALPEAVYVDMPEFVMQIAGEGDKTNFMKLAVTLELSRPQDVEAVRILMPRLQDDFNAFLLNLRVEDLRGSAGLQRVKDALLLRAGQLLSPIKVSNVLYKQVLVQ